MLFFSSIAGFCDNDLNLFLDEDDELLESRQSPPSTSDEKTSCKVQTEDSQVEKISAKEDTNKDSDILSTCHISANSEVPIIDSTQDTGTGNEQTNELSMENSFDKIEESKEDQGEVVHSDDPENGAIGDQTKDKELNEESILDDKVDEKNNSSNGQDNVNHNEGAEICKQPI